MKIKKQSVSRTGNGVYQERLQPFIVALKDFEKLIKSIYKFYEKNPKDTFSGKFNLLNNWHDIYKIDLRNEEFPFHLCNGIDYQYCGWNSVILSCKFPLKFKAPTFHGGETESMSVALTTEISLYKGNILSFLENDKIPNHIKIEILKAVKKSYEENVEGRYREDQEHLINLAKKKKLEICEAEEMIKLNDIEIPKIEKRIKELEVILKTNSAQSV